MLDKKIPHEVEFHVGLVLPALIFEKQDLKLVQEDYARTFSFNKE
jgi:hypothetical protein